MRWTIALTAMVAALPAAAQDLQPVPAVENGEEVDEAQTPRTPSIRVFPFERLALPEGAADPTAMVADAIAATGRLDVLPLPRPVDFLVYANAEPDTPPEGACPHEVGRYALAIKILDPRDGAIRFQARKAFAGAAQIDCAGTVRLRDATPLPEAVDATVGAFVQSIYPIQVAQIAVDGKVTLNYGQVFLKPGDTLRVFRRGAAIVDPVTGETLGSNESRIATVRVDEVAPRFAIASIVGDVPEPIRIGDIARQ